MRRLGLGDVVERLDGLGIAPGHEIGAAQMVPEALRMIGVEPHSFADPLDAFLRPAQPSQDFSLLDHDKVIVRVETKRPFLMKHGLVMVVIHQVHGGQDTVYVAVGVVKRERLLRLTDDSLSCRPLVLIPAMGHLCP